MRRPLPSSVAGARVCRLVGGFGALLALALTAGQADAQSPLVQELRTFAFRYHENLPRLFQIRDGLEAALRTDDHVDNLNALAWVSYIIGDLRTSTPEEKLAAYDRGRQAAKRAIEKDPKNVGAHFWYGVNTARWGQTNGIVRSLFLLPSVKKEIQTVLDLDPNFTPVYNLAGNVYLEVPGLLGGDLDRAEQFFRTGLAQDPKDTAIRLGLAKALIKKKRVDEARRELQTILEERAPRDLAGWTLKHSVAARTLLESLGGKS